MKEISPTIKEYIETLSADYKKSIKNNKELIEKNEENKHRIADLEGRLYDLKSEVLLVVVGSIGLFIFGLVDYYSKYDFRGGLVAVSFFIALGVLDIYSKLNK